MGRHTGAVERLSRREGVDLELKGARRMAGKGALERRGPTPPGQHGMARRRRESVYALQLREKQRAKRYYGVRERQFRNYFAAASKRSEQGLTGERLLVLLEQRLDNVVYRLGLATTRAQARQFVSHGHVSVDGARCDIPSRRVHPDSVVTVSAEAPIVPLVREATELIGRVAPWLQADHEALAGKVLRDPARGEIDAPVSEGLIVEFYSRV